MNRWRLIARLTSRARGWERVDWIELRPLGVIIALIPAPRRRRRHRRKEVDRPWNSRT